MCIAFVNSKIVWVVLSLALLHQRLVGCGIHIFLAATFFIDWTLGSFPGHMANGENTLVLLGLHFRSLEITAQAVFLAREYI